MDRDGDIKDTDDAVNIDQHVNVEHAMPHVYVVCITACKCTIQQQYDTTL